MGWVNRSAYEFRSMFVPKQTVRRQFIPQTVVQSVPVTRKVAVQSTRQVTYNVTRMVAQRSTRQVAMNHVTYEDVETTAMVPRTVMRHVPIGTQMSYSPLGGGQLSLQPTPDSSSARSIESRSATRGSKDAFDSVQDPNNYKKDNNDVPIKPKGVSYPRSQAPAVHPDGRVTKSPTEERPAVAHRSSPPSLVRLNKWVARTPKSPDASTPDISVADVDR